MILYFANRNMEIIGHATTNLPEGFVVVEDLKKEEIESGVSVFDCTIGFNSSNRKQLEAMTDAGNFLLRSDGDENEFYTIIDSEIDTKNREIYIYAEDAGLDLLNEITGAYTATEAHTAEWYISHFAGDSGFEIGINEIPESSARTLSWDGQSTVTERLASIATQFGGFEINYSYKIEGMEISHKYINIYAQRGKNIDSHLRLNREIDRIVTKKSVANLATALEVTGGTPEGSDEPITLNGYGYDDGNFYVDGTLLKSREALKRWGRHRLKHATIDGHIVRLYSYDTLSQSELLNRALRELKQICGMEVYYEVEINELPKEVKIGDRINVVDDEGELYLSARILELSKSITEQKHTAVLGEYIRRSSGISQTLEDLAEQIKKLSANNVDYYKYINDVLYVYVTQEINGEYGLAIQEIEGFEDAYITQETEEVA